MTLPYVTLSCAISLDGYLSGEAPQRLIMSNAEDFDRVDQLRADSDAIMVGASTVRRDDPRLLVRSEDRRLHRVSEGRSASPVKVTVTGSGDLPAGSCFFTAGDVEKLVYCPRTVADRTAGALGGSATVVALGDVVTMRDIVHDLAERGIGRLMVEGGGRLHTQFLREDIADELQLVIAPFFVGEPRAPRFVDAGAFPWTATRRARLAESRQIGDVVLLRYALSERAASGASSAEIDGAVAAADRWSTDHGPTP